MSRLSSICFVFFYFNRFFLLLCSILPVPVCTTACLYRYLVVVKMIVKRKENQNIARARARARTGRAIGRCRHRTKQWQGMGRGSRPAQSVPGIGSSTHTHTPRDTIGVLDLYACGKSSARARPLGHQLLPRHKGEVLVEGKNNAKQIRTLEKKKKAQTLTHTHRPDTDDVGKSENYTIAKSIGNDFLFSSSRVFFVCNRRLQNLDGKRCHEK